MSTADLPRRPSPTLLFDLDGTITDSFPGIEASFLHAVDAVGAPTPSKAFTSTIAGPPMIDTLRALGLDESSAGVALDHFLRRYDRLGWIENSVYPGMTELLARLRADGYRMATATSKGETFTRRILAHFDLDGFFDFVGSADDDGPRRSKVDVIAFTLRGLGIEPVTADRGGTPDVLMVGDRAHDVAGAAQFGIPTVAVRWGYGTPQEWDTARWSASDAAELEAVIRDW